MRLTFLLLLPALVLHAEEPAAGHWEGSAQIPGRDLQIVIDLDQPQAGQWTGSAIMPGLNFKGAALDPIKITGDQVDFALKTALADKNLGAATFHGRLSADGKISGDFTQAGNKTTFSLTKTGPPQVDRPPRSTKISEKCEGTWKGTYEMLGYSRSVTLKLENRGAEGAAADWLIVGKRENHLPVDLVVQSGDFLTVDSHETGLSFEARISDEELQGTIIQGPFESSIKLHRDK
jgi:hypothetical protein